MLDDDVAFAVGLLLSLAANAVTVVATAYIGLRSTGSRAVGVAAAALYAVWPLLTRPLAGTSAWENGQWNVDVGLHLYTEPISTALVATAIALLLARSLDCVPARDGRRAARLRDGRAALERALRGGGRRPAGAPARAGANGAGGSRGSRVGPARRRLLAEGLSEDRERPRLLARAGRSQLGRLADLRPADAADPPPAGGARARRSRRAGALPCSVR